LVPDVRKHLSEQADEAAVRQLGGSPPTRSGS
jgi:hypothetical protein